MNVLFDTLAAKSILMEAGVADRQADGMVRMVALAIHDGVATSADIDRLDSRMDALDSRMDALESRIDRMEATLKAEIKDEIRAEIRAETGSLRAEMAALEARMMKVFLGGVIFIVGTLLAGMKFLI